MDKPDTGLHPRYAAPKLEAALADTPVVLIHGPRQCGKTTLARQYGRKHGYDYISFDDPGQLELLRADPTTFFAGLPERVILDEVQRIPEQFTRIKSIVDNNRIPGRFILTGSANILSMPGLTDSLAGRMEKVRLAPLAQVELRRAEPSRFLEALFQGSFKSYPNAGVRLGGTLAERIVAGGFPAALKRQSGSHRRKEWFVNYVDALIYRDARDVSGIRRLEYLEHMLTRAAEQSAQLWQVSNLASKLAITAPTARDYTAVLERLFLIERLPIWSRHESGSILKTPKLHFVDTGLAAALLQIGAEELWKNRHPLYGQLLETYIYQELRRQASWHSDRVRFGYYRDKKQVEVDIVLECTRQVVGIEVKASSTVEARDFRGLQKFADFAGDAFRTGILFYDGEAIMAFDRMHAVPISLLWGETGSSLAGDQLEMMGV
ncbi:MAG: ATP-binding protein [Gammaproteobacteria bacterium AqS3]|nr:ATP-binding protein [Gammaproteobacteria bacterium AqS3]